MRGPIGRYGGPSVIKLGSATLVVLVLIGLVLFNPFTGGDDTKPTAAPTSEVETSSEPESSPAAPETGAPPTTTPTTPPTPTTSEESSPTSAPSSTPTGPESSAPSSTPDPANPPTSAPTTAPTSTKPVVFSTCAEARAAGKAPLYRGRPGYSEALDKNGDGIACERGNS
ncbi:excalibur calcium-binding domain-containing protein [Kribbella sp. NPDC050820]|uniref:excalibur calcium-binding domain-containing protein n=1 Tax=Kribbella sp. NPDC050820 TaxID=3155408 RepID=UPI00340568F9